MDVQKKLDDIVAAVAGARSMPMSASCVVNRAELLGMLEDVRAALPDSLSQAQELLGGRDQMVEEARAEAARIVESAHAERGSLVSGTQIARQSQEEAERILAEARREAEEIRAEADDYVDSKLANFEVVLTKTIGSVDRGREKLLGQGRYAEHYEDGDDPDAPERSTDPETLRRNADEYVDAKLGAFEAVLSKTLEAVGRGRLKLTGHRPIDELGAHIDAQDAAEAAGAQSDAEFLAGLAAPAPQQPSPNDYSYDPAPAAPGYGYQTDYGQQAAYDPYAGQQAQGYPEQAGYGYQPVPGMREAAGGYDQQGYGGQGYADPHQHFPQEQPYPGHQQHQPAALDETSFFDTGMIDLNRLRELEQGR